MEVGGIKREVLGKRERTFGYAGEAEIEERKPERRKREKGIDLSLEIFDFLKKGRESCIIRSSHHQIISEGQVRSLLSIFNK